MNSDHELSIGQMLLCIFFFVVEMAGEDYEILLNYEKILTV